MQDTGTDNSIFTIDHLKIIKTILPLSNGNSKNSCFCLEHGTKIEWTGNE